MKVCIAYTITDRLLKEEAEQHGEVIGEKEAESLRYEKNCVHFTPNGWNCVRPALSARSFIFIRFRRERRSSPVRMGRWF